MSNIRVIAIPTRTSRTVLATMRSPGYGHPAYTELATGHGPCRHCLQPFRVGEEQRTLFTYNPFHNLAPIPLPGPVFIHTKECKRFDEAIGYPAALLPYAVVMDGYDRDQRVIAQQRVTNGTQEAILNEILIDAEVQYVLVRDLAAGCFDLRVERRAEVD